MILLVLLYYMINTISDVKHQYEREDGVGQVESAQSNMEAAVNGQLPQNQDVTGSKRKGISGSTIKIIAVIAMVIDHFAAVVLARQMIASGYLDAMNSGIFEEVMGWLNDNMLLYYSYDLMKEKIEATGAKYISCDKYDIQMNLKPEDADTFPA